MNRHFVTVLWTALFTGSAAIAQPLTTAFTYQGELAQSGTPVSGIFDLQFRLYSAASAGTQIGSTLCINNAGIANGRFTAELDFGAAFTGQKRFLEISVRADAGGTVPCSTVTGYTLLSPRQELTAAPNAAFALNAANATTAATATTATTATNATTANNATQLGGQSAAFYRNAANMNEGTLADIRLSSNVPKLNTTQTFSAQQTFSVQPVFSSASVPFLVSSSTLVSNLNADLLDGNHGAFYRDASNMLFGTLADARLSSNVALLAGAQTFSGGKTFSAAPAFTAAGAPFTTTSTTKVTNLNADLFDGFDSSTFFRTGNPIDLGTTSPGASTVRATNFDVTTMDSSSIRGNIYGTTGVNGVGVIGYKGPSGANHPTIGGGAGVVGYADSGVGIAGVLFGTGTGTAIYGFADSPNASAGLFQGRVAVNGTFDVNLPTKSIQFRMDGGLVPGINLSGTGGNLGIMRFRNAMEIWPNDAGTAPGKLDVRDTSGAARITLEGDTGRIIASGSVDGLATASTGTTHGVRGESLSTTGRGVIGLATATSGFTFGVIGESASTFGKGVHGVATAVTGGTAGVFGQSNSTDGRGVSGYATDGAGLNYGVHGETESTSGRGVFGVANKPTGLTFGVYGRSNSADGRGVFGEATSATGATVGVIGESASTEGRGVFGHATHSTGENYGVFGQSSSPLGRGVFGLATATSGSAVGVHGESDCRTGAGVVGVATHPTLLNFGVYGVAFSQDGRGVYGRAGASTGTTYGVYGNTTSAAGWAVFAEGQLGASGTKSFRIDHPEDPANKYLLHYAAESPEVINFYRGTVTLDGAGGAVVELPRYFALINKDPSYVLTAVGAPMPLLHVAEEIDAGALAVGEKAAPGDPAPLCRFRIAGGMPGAKASWRVEAVRNDRWVRSHGAAVEVEKESLEMGRYKHPALYGQPTERGMLSPPIERDPHQSAAGRR